MVVISAELLKQRFKENPEAVAKLLSDSLIDFGYPVPPSYVQGEMTRQLEGQAPNDLGPALFIEGWLKDGIS